MDQIGAFLGRLPAHLDKRPHGVARREDGEQTHEGIKDVGELMGDEAGAAGDVFRGRIRKRGEYPIRVRAKERRERFLAQRSRLQAVQILNDPQNGGRLALLHPTSGGKEPWTGVLVSRARDGDRHGK